MSTSETDRIDELKQVARDIRTHIIKMTNFAGCGHTGGSLSEADILAALYFDVLNVDPARPDWPDRDRFVLSKGHASPGYYSTLALRGYFPVETLRTFDQINSTLQGHPCMLKTPGVDMSTGSLGQGLSIGIGMTLGRLANGQDFHTFVLMGCGEMQEGQVWEAAMYAGAHQTPNLIAVIDYNKVQLSGTMDEILSSQPIVAKWEAFNWTVMECDGHNMAGLVDTLRKAKAIRDRPVAVVAHTVKGKGVSFMEGRYTWHGLAPNDEQAEEALKEILA